MNALVFLIVVFGVGVGTWCVVARSMRKMGKGAITRHLAGVVLGFLAFFIAAAVLSEVFPDDPSSQEVADANGSAIGGEASTKPEFIADDEPFTAVVEDDVDIESVYQVVSDETMAPYKRTVEVVLSQRINEEQLREIGESLYSAGTQDVDRTFIGYRLEGQGPESYYWGTTHYNPDIRVVIQGLSASEFEKFESYDFSEYEGKIIGAWIAENGYDNLLIAYRGDDGEVYLDSVFADGSVGTQEYNMTIQDDGSSKMIEPEKGYGDYFVIDADGDLQFWGESGNYYTAPQLLDDSGSQAQ